MKITQFRDILKIRSGITPDSLNLQSCDNVSILSVDKAIFRKRLPSGRYTYFILNSKVLDSIRSCSFPPSHKNSIAYVCLIACIYNTGGPVSFDGFDLVGVDLCFDVNVQDITPQLGFSFAFFERLLVGAYSSCSKRIVMTLSSFTRYVLKNNALAKGAQTFFYELYNVQKNKFVIQAELSAGDVLLDIQRRAGSTLGIPTDFFFGKERLKRSRISSSSFSFDLDVYDKGLKERDIIAYRDVTRFELRFRGCKSGVLDELFHLVQPVNTRRHVIESSLFEFLDRAVLFRQRPNKRISKTSFSNIYRWPEDVWWVSVKQRLRERVFHLDDPAQP